MISRFLFYCRENEQYLGFNIIRRENRKSENRKKKLLIIVIEKEPHAMHVEGERGLILENDVTTLWSATCLTRSTFSVSCQALQ